MGMLMGTAVYVNAGSELAQISSLSGLVSAPVIFSLVLLGIFPLAGKLIVNTIQKNKIMKKIQQAQVLRCQCSDSWRRIGWPGSGHYCRWCQSQNSIDRKTQDGWRLPEHGLRTQQVMIRSGRIMSYIKRGEEFGIDGASGEINFARVMERVQGVIKTIEPHDSVERFTSLALSASW